MIRERNAYISACSLVLVTTVALLISGPGLLSLSVPDNEQDATVVALADYAHAGKRIADESVHIAPDATFASSRATGIHLTNSELLSERSFSHLRIATLITTIRGPPLS